MPSLTKFARRELPAERFAFPRTRQCPMTDEKHLFLAWNMVSQTAKVTDAERSEARLRILAAADEMGVDMSKLKKIASLCFESVSLEAMSIEMPTTENHPNKMEFSGILTKVDESSDLAPHGSYGKKVFIPRSVAEAALPTIMGMAVDFTDSMNGHNRKKKIGIITAANIVGNDVQISGFFYANDFPDEVLMIQANKEDLGFSFEAERILVADLASDPLKIESMVFTGAAVLKKKKAAYQSTSIAASAEEHEMTKEEYEALMAAIGGISTRVEKIEKTRLEAASVADKVSTHAAKLKETASAMQAAGVGCHVTRGHAVILNHMADEMMAEAHRGSIPSEYRGLSFYSAGQPSAIDAAAAATAETARTVELKELKDGLASAQTIIKDLQAAAQKQGAPERKTLPARLSSLMAKAGLKEPEDGGKYTIAGIDVALKGTSLSPMEKMEVKTALNRQGLIEGVSAA